MRNDGNEAILLSLRCFLARYLRTEEDTGKEPEKRGTFTMATTEEHSSCDIYQFHILLLQISPAIWRWACRTFWEGGNWETSLSVVQIPPDSHTGG